MLGWFDKFEENTHKELFNRFITELSNWGQSGIEPRDASRQVRMYLNAQEARLREHGLRIEDTYSSISKDTSELKFPHNMTRVGRALKRKLKFYRGNKRIFRRSKHVFMVAGVLDADKNEEGFKDRPYICPNCGNIDTLEHLSGDGCSYCKTHFEMAELFPKVLTYYLSESLAEPAVMLRRHRIILTLGVLGGILYFFINALIGGTLDSLSALRIVFGTIVSGFLGFVLAFFIERMVLMFYVFGKAFFSLPMVSKILLSRSKIDRKLKRYDPQYSYDYILAKVLSLLQEVVFAVAPEQLTIYEGEPMGRYFKWIVDLNYRELFGLRKIWVENGLLCMDLSVFMQVLWFDKGKIYSENREFSMTIAHRADRPIRHSFSIHLVQCKSCGASFDAYTQNRCPYCHSPYELKSDDWVVLACSVK